MSRRKVDATVKLTYKVTIRLSDPYFKKMESWLAKSNCQSLSELARSILYKEQVIWYHKDESGQAKMIELETIRKELNAVGKNINQITRYFNSTDVPAQKIYEALKILDEFKKLNVSTDKLMALLNNRQDGSQDR